MARDAERRRANGWGEGRVPAGGPGAVRPGAVVDLSAQRIWRSAGVRTARGPVAYGFEGRDLATGFGLTAPLTD